MDIEKKLNELKERKDTLYAEFLKCQSEINKLELEKYDTQWFIGRIIELPSEFMITRNSKRWLYVTSVERLQEGPKFHGTQIRVGKDTRGKITFVEASVDSSVTKKWEDLEKLKLEESPEKVMNYFYESLGDIDLGGIMNDQKKEYK